MRKQKLLERENAFFFLFAAVLVGSLFLRLPYVFTERMWPDEALYGWYAQKIFNHPGGLFSSDIVEFHPPLFSFLLSFAHGFLPSKTACQFMALIFGLLGIWGIYRLGRLIGSRFAGLLGAALLAMNALYLRYSTKVLIDALFMFGLMLLAALLYQLPDEEEKSPRADIYVGLMGCALVLLKWTGVLAVALVAGFYIIGLSKLPLKVRCRRLLVPFTLTAAAVLFLLVNNWFQLGQWTTKSSALYRSSFPEPFAFYFINIGSIMQGRWLIPFSLLGFVFFYKKNRKAALLMFLWYSIFLAALTFAAEKLLRYSLMFLPVLLLSAAAGIEYALTILLRREHLRRWGFLLVALMMCLLFFSRWPALENDLYQDNKFYRGYEEAGQWIKDHYTPQTLVMAHALRNIRYHAGMHIHDEQGTLLPLPATFEDIKERAGIHNGPVILEMDNWGNPFAVRFNPFDDSLENDLISSGFSRVLTAGQMRYRTSDGEKKAAPALWLFAK